MRRTMSAQERAAHVAQKVEAAQALLAERVAALQSGQDWKRFLEFQSRLHSYSPNNVMLITSQHIDAYAQGLVDAPLPRYVAGFHAWKALGRSVDKGQHGYAVLAPMTRLQRVAVDHDGEARRLHSNEVPLPDELEDRRRVLRGFKIEHVFELGQTSGAPIPEPPRPKLLEGTAPPGLHRSVTDLLHDRGFSVETVPDSGAIEGANGMTDPIARRVVIRTDMDDAAVVKTLLHEAAHVLLHAEAEGRVMPRPIKEVEAESVAFVVAAAHGMETDVYSFPYVAGWAGRDGSRVVQATQARVATAAKVIMETSPADHGSGGKAPGVDATIAVAASATVTAPIPSPIPEPHIAIDLGVGLR